MSTQPTIIQIVDRIDPTIAAKINGIATAARTAAVDVNNLQAALNNISSTSALNSVTSQLSKLTPVSAVVAHNAVNLSKAIGTIPAAATAATQSVTPLGAALATTTSTFIPAYVNLIKLSQGLGKIPVDANSVSNASTTLGKALVNLISRVGFATVGLGRFGGAFGGVATKLVATGPLIIAGLAALAVAGAVIIYEKFRAAANALADTQTALGKQFGSMSDRILEQKERLSELTDGPLAKYAQELRDLPFKTIDVDFSNVEKELENQHSWWKRIDTALERVVANAIKYGSLRFATPANTQAAPDLRDTADFLKQEQARREQGLLTNKPSADELTQFVRESNDAAKQITFNRKQQLEAELHDVRARIQSEDRLLADETGSRKQATEVNLAALRHSYQLDLAAYKEYLGNKTVLTADAAKAAAAEQLKQFTEEMDRLKASVPGGVTTAQDELALRQQQLAGAPRPTAITGLDSRAALKGAEGGNVRKLTDDITKLTTEINKQGFEVDNLVKHYQNAVSVTGAYSDALKVEAEFDKLVADVQSKRIPITDALAKRLHEVAEQGVEDAKVNRELVDIYNEFQGPIERYATTLKATTELLKQNAITAQQAEVANARAARAMQDAIDPLNEYKIGLQHEIGLLKEYGEQLNVATEVDRVRQDLQREGYDLDQKSIDTLSKFLTLLDQQRSVQAEETRLWEANAGAKQKIYEQQLALNKAYFDGVINLSQWKAEALDAALATNKLNNEITGGTLKSNIVQLYGGLITQLKGAHPVIHALQTDFLQFFASLKKGFADSIAHVLVFGGSLKTALLDTARSAVAALLSSLIELGIEFLIVTALSKAFGITLPKKDDGPQKQIEQLAIAVASIAVITATQLAAINALLGPAWALAEAVSLASFGANAAAATAGIASVVAAGAAAQTAGRFATGGLIQGKGTGTSDDILMRASHGEFVVNAKATAKNRDLLEAINHNDDLIRFRQTTIARFADGGMVGYTHPVFDYSTTHTGDLIAPSVRNTMQMKVNVVHDGSTGIQVEQIDAMTVRIIARQEAKSAVHEHGPRTIASEVFNPNSETSKALTRNYGPRKR